MARKSKKSLEERILEAKENLDRQRAQVAKEKEKLELLNKELANLELEKKEQEINSLYDIVMNNGLSVEEVEDIINEYKKNNIEQIA